MAIPTPQYVRDLSLTGEFDDLTDAQIDNVSGDEVSYQYEAMADKSYHTRAVGLHTAHILWGRLKSGGGGGGNNVGQLVRAKVGPLEKQYGQAFKQIDPTAGLSSSQYGRDLLELLSMRLAMRTSNP